MNSGKVKNGLSAVRGDVAIIGMDCVFPNSPDIKAFWHNITSKVDAITDVPSDRWDPKIYFDPDSTSNDRVYCKRGGYIKESTQFDPLKYGVMPSAVLGGDPSQFLALKVTYQALDNAGYLNKLDNRERIGVILGRGNYADAGVANAMMHSTGIEMGLHIIRSLHPEYTKEYIEAIKKDFKSSLPYFGPDNIPSLMPNITTGRIANRLDLMGPNFTLDAACASALIAVELGISDLLTHKHDLVLVGGVFMLPDALFQILFCQLKALSKQSQIRPFDKNADGTIIGEGVGILVLKRLEDAERDNDTIYAVIKGIGTSSDGKASSVLAPRIEGEELALKRAYEMSSISPATIELIEAHGTGTPVGDHAEIEALTRVFGKRGESPPWCALGSIKSMIGHTMHAAGAASLIKAVLAIHHKVLPPTLHCDDPYPTLEQTPFYINTETRPWIHGDKDNPRRAGVSAFGFGGINAHIVLEEYHSANENNHPNHLIQWDTEVCVLQGQSRHSLIQRTQQVDQYLEANPQILLKDLAYTLNTTLDDKPYTLAIVASSPDDFKEKLRYALKHLADTQCSEINDARGIYFFEKPVSRDGKIAFLFPEEGSQYAGMLSDLCIHFPEVRNCFDELDAAFFNQQRNNLPSHMIFPQPTFTKTVKLPAEERIWPIDTALGSVFTANKALFTTLMQLKLRPDVLLGYGTGEISSISASEMAKVSLQHIRTFGQNYEKLVAKAGIPELTKVAVWADHALVSAIVDKIDGNIFITMDNSPKHVVIVGERPALEQAIGDFESRGLTYEKLPFDRPYHIPLLEIVDEHFGQLFNGKHFNAPKIETWSCMTGQPYPQDVAEIQKLAVGSLVCPVKFRQTIEAMHATGVRIFVEVGPGNSLTTFVDDTLQSHPHLAIASNVPNQSGITQLNQLVGILAAQGIAVNFDFLYSRRIPSRLSLDETHLSDAKDTSNSTMMNLTTSPYNIFSWKPTAKELETTQTHSKSANGPHETNPPAPSPITQRGSQGSFISEASQWLEKNDQKGDAMATEETTPDTSLRIMDDYFQTMRHFLEVQQRVMKDYLTRGRLAQKPREEPADQLTTFQTRPMMKTEELSVSPPGNFEVSKHEETTLEETADIGLQSLNQAVSTEELSVSSPGNLKVSKHEETTLEETADISLQSLNQAVLNVVSERTGYPPEALNLDLDMEADLGIDSIKRIEILGSFQEQFPSLMQEEGDIGQIIDQVSRLKTLQQVIDFLRARLRQDETFSTPLPSSPDRADVSGNRPTTFEEHPLTEVSDVGTKAPSFPFIGNIISHIPGQEVVLSRQIDLSQDVFLNDHNMTSAISATDDKIKPLYPIPATIGMEIMAEAAAMLEPNKLLIGMKDIEIRQGILIEEEKPKTIQVSARKQTSNDQEEVVVEIYEVDEGIEHKSVQDSPNFEGKMVFADTYPDSPTIEAFSLKNERLPKFSAEELYKEKLMFHGPRFQGVVSLDRLGEDGLVGHVKALPNTGLFRSNPNPQFITDPFIIDAIGQLAAYWPFEYLKTDFNVYPIRIRALHLYGPMPYPSEHFRSQVRICQVTSRLLSADVDVMGVDDCVRMRLIGWEARRYHGMNKLFQKSKHPSTVAHSVPWDTPIIQLPSRESFQCYRLNFDNTILKQPWVHAMLSQHEMDTWRNSKDSESRQFKWLIGKVVAKEALAMFLKERHGIDLPPMEIEIAADDNGRPVPRGTWTEHIPTVPALSVTHTDGLAAALVGYCSDGKGIGIDVELLRQDIPHLAELAFTTEEQSLLDSLGEARRQEWMIRFWCAKEAVGKALGCGLTYGPQNLTIREMNIQTGLMHISLQGRFEEAFPELAGAKIVAYTAREGDYIVASSLCEED